jgi:hypothetical protein
MDTVETGTTRTRTQRAAARLGDYLHSTRFAVLAGLLLLALVAANFVADNYGEPGGGSDQAAPDVWVGYPEPDVAISPPMVDRGMWWPGAAGDGSMVASSSQLSLSVEDADEKLAVATRLVEDAGGFVVSSQLERLDRAAPSSAYLTARVPSSELEPVLRELSALGVVLSRGTYASDVSGTFNDLSAQLERLRAEERELAAIVESPARRPAELLEVVQRLSQVRAEIGWMESELSSLERRVEFALLQVTLAGAEVPLSGPGAWSVASEFRGALAQLAGVVRTAVALTARLLVFGVPVLVVSLPAWWTLRRRSRRRADAAPSDLSG